MDDFKDLLEDLSEQEKQEVYKILNEYNNNGESKSLSALYDEDFEEIPVDIDTFLEDDMYCGQTTDNGKLIYPYWREQLRELFKDPNKYQEVAITGCLSGDTIIPLLNGDKVSIKELASRNKLDEYVYSFDVDTNKYVSGHLVDAFSTGIKDVYKITLDNGEFVVATSNHKFMLRNKNWKSIDSGLKVGDSLMPLYRGSVKCGNGYYESIKHPQKDGTFIVSIEYIGKEEVYDLTIERYHNFALESGIVAHNSIGTGKSTVACYGMAYLLYRTMCLRDPVRYYKLTGGSTIVFAFFNNTLDLVNAVGFKTVQDIVMKSPWFMERGKVSGTKYLEYLPDKPVRFRVGSTAQHALGTHILCLSGETFVETNNGIEKIKNLVDKNVIVKSYDKENNKIVYSEECKVYQTGIVNEIYEIELDDGSVLKCTPDHKFMLKNGEYKKAKDLTENDELFDI